MSENPILVAQAQYARHRNKIPQYIGKLQNRQLPRTPGASVRGVILAEIAKHTGVRPEDL